MNFSRTVGFISLGICSAVFAAGEGFQWKPVCESKGHTLIVASDHFEVCKKAKNDDGSENTVTISTSDAQNAIKTLEGVFQIYHDSVKWMYPQPSNATSKFKSVAYIYPNEKMSALYGGTNAEACDKNECSPALWLGVGSLKDYWGLAHEYAHGLQGVAGWMGNNSHTGWIAESHANWMAHQVNSTDAHYCSEALINFPYLYYGSTRDRYCNWQFMEHLKEEFGGGWEGVQKVNRIWMNSIKDGQEGRMEQTPFTAMLMTYGWKLEELNEQFGKFAMKNATLEYAPVKKALYKKTWGDYEFTTRRTTGYGDIYRRHPRVTMLDLLEPADTSSKTKTDARYVSPSYWAPQRWGYNLVRLYPDEAGRVSIKFRGIVQDKKTVNGYSCFGDNTDWYLGKSYKWCNYAPDQLPDPASSWTVGLVAEGKDGTPRYSEMKNGTAFNLDIETKVDDKALYLVVVATPTEMQTILWDQFYYSIYRYPYMVEVENGAPEGYNKDFWKPAGFNGISATGYSKHSNGGGWVSSKAKVDATVYVGPDAVVNGGTITGKARIEDFAVVNGGTISGNAIVRGRALVTAGSIGDEAILEEDSWLVSGTISGSAKVGALSIIVNSTVTDDAQVQGVMWAVSGKKLSGTAQLRGDLENNFTKELTKGVFFGMVDDGMLNIAGYGANLTTPPTDVTASIKETKWYSIPEDEVEEDPEDPPSDQPADQPTDEPGKDFDVLTNMASLTVFKNSHFLVFDMQGRLMGRIKISVGTVDAIQDAMKQAGFTKGVYIVQSPKSRQILKFQVH